MAHLIMFYLSSLLILASALQGIHAVEYSVTNKAPTTPGGIRFNKEVGAKYSKETLMSATTFIWKIFQYKTTADTPNVQRVSLVIDTIYDADTFVMNNAIYFSAIYIEGYAGDFKKEFTGYLYHGMTHIWQWTGKGQAPQGLIEGIADFVRLKAGYARSDWVKPGQGDRWDEGDDVTARFLDYCDSLKNGFVAELNKKMRYGYSDQYFVKLLGKTVDQLWSDYKAKYKN